MSFFENICNAWKILQKTTVDILFKFKEPAAAVPHLLSAMEHLDAVKEILTSGSSPTSASLLSPESSASCVPSTTDVGTQTLPSTQTREKQAPQTQKAKSLAMTSGVLRPTASSLAKRTSQAPRQGTTICTLGRSKQARNIMTSLRAPKKNVQPMKKFGTGKVESATKKKKQNVARGNSVKQSSAVIVKQKAPEKTIDEMNDGELMQFLTKMINEWCLSPQKGKKIHQF